MAHELRIENGKASMMYFGEEPWHGLGTRLNEPATSVEAIKAASLNWKVVKVPLFAGNDPKRKVENRYAVTREDYLASNSEIKTFGIVGENYKPLQNCDAFRFFDDIVGQGAAIYHTAGALGNGERVWILAKLPHSIQVADDNVDKFLLLSNSHDGKSSVQIKFTPIRVVCQNTLTMALREGPTLNVIHTRTVQERLHEAKRLLGIIEHHFDQIGGKFNKMAAVRLNSDRCNQYFEKVFPYLADTADDEQLFAKKREKIDMDRNWVRHFFEKGKGNERPGVRGTLWAAYNGVTEYVDHRSERLDSIWFGEGYRIKVRAYETANKFLNQN